MRKKSGFHENSSILFKEILYEKHILFVEFLQLIFTVNKQGFVGF